MLKDTPGSPLVFLDWTPADSGKVVGHRIYRAEAAGAWQPIGASFEPGYVDLTATVLHTYRYAVSAYVDTGQESALCQPVNIGVPGIRTFLPLVTR